MHESLQVRSVFGWTLSRDHDDINVALQISTVSQCTVSPPTECSPDVIQYCIAGNFLQVKFLL